MSEMAKSLRAKMREKAKAMSSQKDQKVDSSDWTPAEMLNSEAKTGLRPVSRQAFRSGGKVQGEACAPRADRKPRKSGGDVKAWVNAKINRNVKDANEEREGIKHDGGMTKGGRAMRADGGLTEFIEEEMRSGQEKTSKDSRAESLAEKMRSGPGKPSNLPGTNIPVSKIYTPEQMKRLERGYEKGGRAKRKNGGSVNYGPMEMPGGKKGASEAQQRATESHQEDLSKPSRGRAGHYADGGFLKFKGDPVIPGMKEGGKTKWIQKAIKKPGALRKALGVKEGQTIPGKKLEAAAEKGGKLGQRARLAQTLSRMNRNTGGRTKKPGTNVNIVIATRPAPAMGGMGPGAMPPPPPGGVPVPVPPPAAGMPPMPMGGIPMPAPAPALGGGLPGGMPPMARKAGGRISKVAKSYQDMEAGSGSGEGRLQKTDIAKTGKGAPTYRKGGKVYSSYKDMDAGAGSGEGRLEKTEIQKRKH